MDDDLAKLRVELTRAQERFVHLETHEIPRLELMNDKAQAYIETLLGERDETRKKAEANRDSERRLMHAVAESQDFAEILKERIAELAAALRDVVHLCGREGCGMNGYHCHQCKPAVEALAKIKAKAIGGDPA